MDKKSNSRRKFLKKLAAGTAGLGVLPNLSPLMAASPFKPLLPKSKVVLVKHAAVINANGQVQQPLIRDMLNKGMTAFTNKKTLTDAWSQFFTNEEKISLKMNALGLDDIQGTDYLQHFSGVSSAITESLSSISLEEKNILIWDRSDEELINGGFTVQREEGSLRVMGTRVARRGEPEGFNPKVFPVGEKSTRVHTFITDECSSYINIPVLKTHGIAGITGSLKNHYGSIDNPRDFHEFNATNPGIPEINAIPVIRNKQKLIIADLLLGVIDGGPRWKPDQIFAYGGILIGTDPVAVDTVMFHILNDKRIETGLEPIETAIHLELSEALGLGNNSMDNIELINIDLG